MKLFLYKKHSLYCTHRRSQSSVFWISIIFNGLQFDLNTIEYEVIFFLKSSFSHRKKNTPNCAYFQFIFGLNFPWEDKERTLKENNFVFCLAYLMMIRKILNWNFRYTSYTVPSELLMKKNTHTIKNKQRKKITNYENIYFHLPFIFML